jgi:CubicO group peptidase (beta-lactamase class C family)
MKVLKWGGLGLLIAFIIIIALSWTKIQRLLTVNSLFDADKIVANFSSMDSAFLHHDLAIGEPKPWPEDIQELPETVLVAGKETNLAAALEELDTTALVIIRDGTLIHESYYKGTERDDLRISWSVAKSFMSALYGQAIEDGVMNISQPIETYLPQLKGTAYEGATVANILNMASGVKFNEDYLDPKSDINDMGRVLGLGGSMDAYTETLEERQYEPGTVWQYVSIDTHVAAMALRKVTGKTLHQLWEETYGAHLGMGKNPFYLTDGKDVAFALGGLNLRTRDYAKFGQLFLQGGEWEGKQLIPAEWVKASTVNLAPNVHPVRGSGYGYQWWVPMPQEGPSKGDYFAIGIYGQYIYVNPAMNIVIAKNAADREFTFAQSNGQHSMNMNINIFRSLAEQLAILQGTELIFLPESTTVKTQSPLKFFLNRSGTDPAATYPNVDDADGGDFAEVFGLARSSDYTELTREDVTNILENYSKQGRVFCTEPPCPSAEELDEAWSKMLEAIKKENGLLENKE